ncbi:MAG: hypothetical protein IIB04_03995 [Acidobacteria bacterium]|nr:hypothetical protein [Acidobacteriota bacterium]MCH8985759.1 hypothetical protein [Acidobacteriota bacterium]
MLGGDSPHGGVGHRLRTVRTRRPVGVPDPASFKTAYWKGFAGELLRFLELLSESKHAETWLAGKHWIKLEHDKFTIHASIEISGAES